MSALLSLAALAPVEHFVVLYVENRAFDHIFGCAQDLLPGIDGVHGNETQWVDPTNHSKGVMHVRCGKANYVCNNGPSQAFGTQTAEIFGPDVDIGPRGPYPSAQMDGYAAATKQNQEALDLFSPDQLPIKTALAREFGLFNKFYSAMPGPSNA